jgi:hypothetical protein
MALIDDVKVVRDRLAPLGRRSLLLDVTGGPLDFLRPTSAALKVELVKTLSAIDRTVTKFTDFSPAGTPAVRNVQCSVLNSWNGDGKEEAGP